MRPFHQQLIWTLFASGTYVSTFLVAGLKDALWLQTIASIIFGAVWIPRPQEMASRRKPKGSP